jgi:peptidyl-prolyl cis-trans isomerase C
MKALSSLVFLFASLAWTQSTPPPASDPNSPSTDPNTVVAIFDDGSKMTLGDFQALIPVLPEKYQQMAQTNPEHFVEVYRLFQKASAAAEKMKLGEKEPYKKGVEFAASVVLANAYFTESTNAITVAPEELEKYYNEHKEPFRQIKVSGIKVAFGTPADGAAGSSTPNASRVLRKVLTEEEAKAKAEKLVAQIRSGGDFCKLVMTDSDDEQGKANCGDLGTWKMTENVPDDLRSAVLSLSQGQVSDPIRQPGAFYVVYANTVSYPPFDEVKDTVFAQVKQQKAEKWFDDLKNSVKVTFPKKDPGLSPNPSDPKK